MNRPKLCAAIINDDLKKIREVEPLIDLFEVRIDLIGDSWEKVAKTVKKPWIATNRTIEEGGRWNGNEARRIERLLQAIELGAEMVDVEYRTKNLKNIVPLVKKRVKCILSFHDTEKTPSLTELKSIVDGQMKAGADICKVVTTAREFQDNLTVLELVRSFHTSRIVSFAMGQSGQTSRLLSPLVGADFTYGSIEEGKESAPGQITVQQMIATYNILGIGD
ncbi:MAG: type I 3-dehydroquinate dehydratase [Dehalococcoidales bacterium]|nr:MAG: type I 3-dehydroquinate dehydratase [Dehalococcoidales bacterium]